MNAVFMPMAAVVSGRVWQSLPAADRELITKTVKSTLDAQIDELAGNEPKLIENFKNAPIPIRQVTPRIPRPSLPSLTGSGCPRRPFSPSCERSARRSDPTIVFPVKARQIESVRRKIPIGAKQ